MKHTYLNQPTLLLRELPNSQSQVATELFYGELLTTLEETNEWTKLRSEIDGYTGWVKRSDYSVVEKSTPYTQNARVMSMKAHVYSEKDTVKGPIISLPFRSRIHVITSEPSSRWLQVELLDGSLSFIQQGNIEINPALKTMKDLVAFALHLSQCNIPYFFGGRTMWDGFDCSGLTQMLFYEFLGICLERDAKQQITSKYCREVSLDTILPGDLIFWGKNENKITHVGLYIGNDQFVHANVRELQGKISVSTLSDPLWNQQGEDLPFRSFRRVKMHN